MVARSFFELNCYLFETNNYIYITVVGIYNSNLPYSHLPKPEGVALRAGVGLYYQKHCAIAAIYLTFPLCMCNLP